MTGGSASPVGSLRQIWGWSSRDVSLAGGMSIKRSFVVMGPSLGLRHPSSLPMEEACASSGMGFRAPGSLKDGFAGVGSELVRSSLGLRHSSSLPVEEACASSGMGFRAPESLKGSFVGVGSELARSSLGLGHSPSFSVEGACASSGMGFAVCHCRLF